MSTRSHLGCVLCAEPAATWPNRKRVSPSVCRKKSSAISARSDPCDSRIIEPATQALIPVECNDIRDAMALAGLGHVDHSVIMPGLGIALYGIWVARAAGRASYFAIHGRLYAGNAVLYAFNQAGETVSLLQFGMPDVMFMPDADAVERNIALGLVERPQTTVNGLITWQWPERPWPEHPVMERRPQNQTCHADRIGMCPSGRFPPRMNGTRDLAHSRCRSRLRSDKGKERKSTPSWWSRSKAKNINWAERSISPQSVRSKGDDRLI